MNENNLISVSLTFIHQKGARFNIALLQRNKTGAVSGSDTGSSVLDWLVCQGELAQVVPNHLGLDFHLSKHTKKEKVKNLFKISFLKT